MSNIEQELKILRADIQGLKAEISSINENLSAIEELLRLLVANQMLNNLEIKKPTPKKSAEKISALGFLKNIYDSAPTSPKEIIQGHAKIYHLSNTWIWAEMVDGTIYKESKIRILRRSKKLFSTSIIKLQYLSDAADEVPSVYTGYFRVQLSGIGTDELKKDDIIESYILE